MANTKSAKKAIRVAKTNRMVNVARDNKVRVALKAVRSAPATKEESLKIASKLQSELDKAVKVGRIHKNKANRMKAKAARSLKSSLK